MSISGRTKVCALIGNPVEHSLSPFAHNIAFQYLELDYIYVAFKVEREELDTAIRGVRSLGIHGLNVTMPLKVDVIKHLDRLDKSAREVGAVNTILNKNGTLIGYNTDGRGALLTLETNKVNLSNKKIVILGAGGASRAISYNIARVARKVAILNRTVEKAESLVGELSQLFGNKVSFGNLVMSNIKEELKDADILINATSLGMYPNIDKTPIVKELLRSDLTVFDLVYYPLETRLLKEAKLVGARTIGGLSMLIQQGAASFETWTKEKAPIDVMMKTVKERLKSLERIKVV